MRQRCVNKDFYLKDETAVILETLDGKWARVELEDCFVNPDEMGWELTIISDLGKRVIASTSPDLQPLKELGPEASIRPAIPIRFHVTDGSYYPVFTVWVPEGTRVLFTDRAN